MTTLSDQAPSDPPPAGGRVWEVARLFLKLGTIGFGGPAATIAMMDDEVVARRGWLSRQQFLDLVGVTNLIPGPNAAELAIHIGYRRAGWPGLFAAGAGFIIPAALISAALGWAYSRYGALPAVAPYLMGIKPAVLVIVVAALWRLGAKAMGRRDLFLLGLAVAVSTFLGANEILALFGGGLLGAAWLQFRARPRKAGPPAHLGLAWLPPLLLRLGLPWAASAVAVPAFSLVRLALFFLKTGAVLYGTGYVLIAFLQGDLVQTYGWLTQQQLLDAVAAGQLTPGPLLSTASFIGYLLAGAPGAALSTLAIFTPSFLFVIIVQPIVPHLRRSAWTAAFLDAVNASSISLMAAVTVQLGIAVLTGWQSVLIALLAGVAAWRWRLNSAWLVAGGAILGLALSTT